MASALHDGDISVMDDDDSIDWKEKYMQLKELLDEARTELEEFQISSRELEEELETELQRIQQTEQGLRDQVGRLEDEREDWTAKFRSANDISNKLQNELTAAKQAVADYRSKVVQLELGNDDLERNEREATASYKDMEQRYARMLEEKTLVETELAERGVLVDENQRLKDEIRDMAAEMVILQQKLVASRSAVTLSQSTSALPTPSASPLSSSPSTRLPAPAPRRISSLSATIPSGRPRPAPPMSKGLSMANDMRERAKALQAKIGTGFPRVRLNSLTRAASLAKTASSGRLSTDSGRRPSGQFSRRSSQADLNNSNGWVVVNELDTPRPKRTRPPRVMASEDQQTVKPHNRPRASLDSALELSSSTSSRRSSIASTASSLKPQTPPAPPSSFRLTEASSTTIASPTDLKSSVFGRPPPPDLDKPLPPTKISTPRPIRPTSALSESRTVTSISGSITRMVRHKRSQTMSSTNSQEFPSLVHDEANPLARRPSLRTNTGPLQSTPTYGSLIPARSATPSSPATAVGIGLPHLWNETSHNGPRHASSESGKSWSGAQEEGGGLGRGVARVLQSARSKIPESRIALRRSTSKLLG